MRVVAPAALFAASLLLAASASADNGAAPPPAAAPPAAAPALAAPPAAPVAPAYPAPQMYPPAYPTPYSGYPPPYMVVPYAPPGAGAPMPYWMPPPPPTERRSNALRNTGIVLFGVGGAVSVVGAVLFFGTITNPCEIFDEANGGGAPDGAPQATHERVRSAHQALNGCDTDPGLGLGVIAAGLLTAAVGIPLFVVGSKQVPVKTTTGKLVPEVRVGAANGMLRWTF